MELQKVQRTTLTMKEASEYLGISYWLINQLVRRKQIPCSKVGGKYLFRVQALDEYLTKVVNGHSIMGRGFFIIKGTNEQELINRSQWILNQFEFE